MTGNGAEPFFETTERLINGRSTNGTALLRRAENHHAAIAQVGTKVDQVADMLPALLAEGVVGVVTCRPSGATINQWRPTNCSPSDEMMPRYWRRCSLVMVAGVADKVNGAISMPV